MMAEKVTSDVSEAEEGDDGESQPPATFLLATEGIDTLRKYHMKFHVSNPMVALSSTENKVYRVQ
jgi:hypothetical protein